MEYKKDKRTKNLTLRNTTAGQFAELGKAIHQCAASLDDVCNATNNLREAFNSVPPYQYRRTTVCAIGIIKKVSIAISLLLALITLCLI